MERKPNHDAGPRGGEKAEQKVAPPVSSSTNADQIAYWNSAAGERWATLQERIDGVFAPLTAAALAFADPAPGTHVLDIGCGAGATVLQLARAVGPEGRVCGVDVSKPMLAVAKRRVAAERLGHVDLLLENAATHAFAPRRFELAFSRFGVMFFADPVGAFINVRKGMATGSRLVFACWQAMPASSWFEVPAAAVRPLLPPPASIADPAAPGPFAFADPDRLRGILHAAGFHAVRIEPHLAAMNLGDVPAALDFVTQVGPTSRAIGETDPRERPALVEAVRSALVAHEGAEGVVLDGAIWLVAAFPSG